MMLIKIILSILAVISSLLLVGFANYSSDPVTWGFGGRMIANYIAVCLVGAVWLFGGRSK